MPARYKLLTLVWAMQFVNYLDRINISVAAPTLMRSLSIDVGSFGMVFAAFTMGYAAMQIPGGFLADKYGSKVLLVCAPLGWSMFTVLTGTATSLTTLIIVRFLFGLCEGLSNASLYKLIGDNFNSRERAGASAVWQSALALGPAAVAPITAWLLLKTSWEHLFFWFAIPGLLIAALLFLALPAQGSVIDDADAVTGRQDVPFRESLKRRNTWLILFGYLTFNIGYWGYLAWMPSYLSLARHLKIHTLGYAASIPYVVGFVGLVIFAWLSNTVLHRYRPQLVAVGYVLAGAALYLTFMAQNLVSCVIYLSVAAFFIYGNFPPTAALLLDTGPVKGRGAFAGCVNTAGQIGGMFAPLAVGFAVRITGSFEVGFAFMIIALVCSALCFLTLLPHVPTEDPHHRLAGSR